MKSFAEQAYNRSPIWLQNLLVTAYGTRLRALRYGGRHGRFLSELVKTERGPAPVLREMQNQALRKMVAHAKRYVPFYSESHDYRRVDAEALTTESLANALPVLEKTTVRANAQHFHSRAYKASDLVSINTSGTTGAPLDVKVTRTAVQRNYAFFARMLRWYGVGATADRCVTFAGRIFIPQEQTDPPFWRHNWSMRTLMMSSYRLTDNSIPDYVRAIERFQPQYIDSYPSAIHALATWINRTGAVHTIRPKVIVTSSETLADHQREAIERAFCAPVRDHYGSAEMAAWITQCEYGRYHANPEYGIVEILRADGTACAPGEIGEICCTGFVNDAMPLIRYKIGDSATFGRGSCECGRPYQLIEKLVGRTDDLIVTPEGRQIGRLDPVFKGAGGIEEAQIIQTSLTEVEVLVVARANFGQQEMERLREELAKRLSSSMRVSVRVVDAIPREGNGKFRAVVSRVQRSLAQ